MSELTDRKAQSRGRAFAARLTGACNPVSARGCPPSPRSLCRSLGAFDFALAESCWGGCHGAVGGRRAGQPPLLHVRQRTSPVTSRGVPGLSITDVLESPDVKLLLRIFVNAVARDRIGFSHAELEMPIAVAT